MEHVDKIEVVDGRLLVDVALTKGTPSGSGKSIVFFSPKGNTPVGGGYAIGINLYKKAQP